MTRKYLEELGLEKDVIDKIMSENGNDIEKAKQGEQKKFNAEKGQLQGQITDLQEQITARDADLTALNDQLTTAKADAAKLPDVQNTLAGIQSKYEAEKQEWEAKNAKQAYEFAVKTEAGKLKFSSTAAQRDFIRGAIDAGFKLDDGKIIGFKDYVEKYKTDDPAAFVAEKDPEPAKPEPSLVVFPSGKASPSGNNSFGFHFNGVRPAPKE